MDIYRQQPEDEPASLVLETEELRFLAARINDDRRGRGRKQELPQLLSVHTQEGSDREVVARRLRIAAAFLRACRTYLSHDAAGRRGERVAIHGEDVPDAYYVIQAVVDESVALELPLVPSSLTDPNELIETAVNLKGMRLSDSPAIHLTNTGDAEIV